MYNKLPVGSADIYPEHLGLMELVTPVLMSESKCQERLVAVHYSHMWIFHSLCVPRAVLHLDSSWEKSNVPLLSREQNYGNVCCVLTGDFHLYYFSMQNTTHQLVFIYKLETRAEEHALALWILDL